MPRLITDARLRELYGADIFFGFKGHPPFTAPDDNEVPLGTLIVRGEGDDQRVLCYECKEWVKSVSIHVRMMHRIKAATYKKRYGFKQHAGLIRPVTSRAHAKMMIEKQKNGKAFNPIGALAHIKNKKGFLGKRHVVQTRNRFNSCPAQHIYRYKDLAKRLKREPTSYDVRKHDNALFDAIYFYYGSWRKFLAAMALMNNNPA